MAPRNTGTPSTWRLRLGESVLFAARATDTSLVKNRLERFERAHQDYVEAQQKIDAAEAQLRAAESRLADCDAVHDKAVVALSGVLIGQGQRARNPFVSFGGLTPRKITRLPFAEEAVAVHQLVAAMQRDQSLGEAALKAAHAAEKAARAVEQALVPFEKMQEGVREARRMRDVHAQAWDSALAALRHDARAAARDGAPQLYAALFPPTHPGGKPKTPADPPPAPDTAPEPTPPATVTA